MTFYEYCMDNADQFTSMATHAEEVCNLGDSARYRARAQQYSSFAESMPIEVANFCIDGGPLI